MADVTMRGTTHSEEIAAKLDEQAHHALRDAISGARNACASLVRRAVAFREAVIPNRRLLKWIEALIAFAIVALLFLWTDALKAILWLPFSILK